MDVLGTNSMIQKTTYVESAIICIVRDKLLEEWDARHMWGAWINVKYTQNCRKAPREVAMSETKVLMVDMVY
jgi:hypothetical protein